MPIDTFNIYESSNIIISAQNTRKLNDYMYKISLKDLEQNLFDLVYRQACEIIVDIPQKIDIRLMKE